MARILKDDRVMAETPLTYAGQRSTFGGRWQPKQPGDYVIEVLALDPAAANFGRHRLTIRVVP